MNEEAPSQAIEVVLSTEERCARSWSEIEAASRAAGERASASWSAIDAANGDAAERARRHADGTL